MKKIYGILCAMLVLFCASTQLIAAKTPALDIGKVHAKAGESVDVPLTISNNTGLCGVELILEYDEALEFDSISIGDALSDLTFTKPGNLEANPVKLLWDGTEGDTSNGVILILSFTAPKAEGIYSISASYQDGNVINGKLESVDLEIVKGAVIVGDLEYSDGDVTSVFSDVYNDWYREYVQYVYDNALMTGISGTNEFRPNANITKAQVAQVLYNMENKPNVTNKKVFSELRDVYEAEWYANAVAWSYNNGIVTGDLNTKQFSPNANVTREQLALMLYRYAAFKEYDIQSTSDLAGLLNAENVNNWAADGVKWAVGSGLISGIDKNGAKDLAPQGNASRAQMAAILMRFCETY